MTSEQAEEMLALLTAIDIKLQSQAAMIDGLEWCGTTAVLALSWVLGWCLLNTFLKAAVNYGKLLGP